MNTKNSQPKISFIIPTLSNREGLFNVLGLLSKFFPDIPVVIVNNNQSDDLQTKIDSKKYLNEIIVISNKINAGFAEACNTGATRAKESFDPKYLIFLNDDVEFSSDWVSQCMDSMEKNKWAATSPVLMKPDGTVENYGYEVLPHGKVKLITERPSKYIDGLSATALLIESNIFYKIGGFDERFFAYLEDVDLFLRLKNKGYKFAVTQSVSVTHHGQQTSSKFKTKKAFYDFRNWFYLIGKNWGWKKILMNLPGILLERGRNFSGLIKSLSG